MQEPFNNEFKLKFKHFRFLYFSVLLLLKVRIIEKEKSLSFVIRIFPLIHGRNIFLSKLIRDTKTIEPRYRTYNLLVNGYGLQCKENVDLNSGITQRRK